METRTEDTAPAVRARKLSKGVCALLFFLLGTLTLIAIRFATIKDTSVHYHTNFGLYVNGQKDPLSSFTFYEEVQACSSSDTNNVKAKAHLHDNNPGLVHVHGAGITWGQFFANLGYGLSNQALTTDEGIFANGDSGNKLSFLINGQPATNIANQVMKSEDTLLIDYGQTDNETMQQRFNAIQRDAAVANTQDDPATCSGSQGLTFGQRLKQAIGLSQPTERY